MSLPTAAARIVTRNALFYADGADRALDRPRHVRAGSGISLVETPAGRRLLIAQDDASFLAVVDPATLVTTSIALPAGHGGRRTFDEASGTKKYKMDLECLTVLPSPHGPCAVSLGSGSSPRRERVVLVRFDAAAPDVRVVDAHALYAALRAHPLLAEAELNLEGACPVGPLGVTTRLFQRGNGAGAVDATFDVDTGALFTFFDGGVPPVLRDARRWDLGSAPGHPGVKLTFTDACAVGDDIVVIAAAEDSPNAVDDGAIVGCAFGVLGGALAPITDIDGSVFVGKPEGVAIDPLDRAHGWLVVDKDDATAPAELLEIAVTWR